MKRVCIKPSRVKGAKILPLHKLSSKEFHLILISNTVNKSTSNTYFKIYLKIQL